MRHRRLEEGKVIELWKGESTQDSLKEESVWKLHSISVFTKKEFRKASEVLFTLERGEEKKYIYIYIYIYMDLMNVCEEKNHLLLQERR